jgi:hypothetical protein
VDANSCEGIGTRYQHFVSAYLLFRKIGMVVEPLHLDVCVVLCLEMSSSSFRLAAELLLSVDTFPPLRIRRRFVPIGPGKFIFRGSTMFVMINEGDKFLEAKS